MDSQVLYKTREGGATVTVFVPYDCKNNCPFCINKQEYKDMEGFSKEKILESIKLMGSITPKCDFVFTGGEPMANLEVLSEFLDAIEPTHRVFINTTLPVSKTQTEEDVIAFATKHKDKITCINISRHMQHFTVESNDSLLEKLPVPFRINCVLFKDYDRDGLVPFMERFMKIPGANIQYRFDYTATTPENLYEKDTDKIIQDLMSVAEYKGLDGCRMRCGFHFDYKGLETVYHKTLPYSTIVEKDEEDGKTYHILYDILIKQNGEIHSDWRAEVVDDVRLDIEAYKNVKFEPNDNKWIEKYE